MGTGVAPTLLTVGKPFLKAAGGLDLRIPFQARASERVHEKTREESGQASRAISTGLLHALLRFHSQPIDVLVSDDPLEDRSLGEISS